jgi:membrane fusion protein (multidrug efflux system)
MRPSHATTKMHLMLCTNVMMMCWLVGPALSQEDARAVVPVGIALVERKPITLPLEFVGHVQAVDRVQISARVTGFLEAILFKEGDVVKEGASLYRLEQVPFRAAVEEAQDALKRSRMVKTLTANELERAERLAKAQSDDVVVLDQARAADAEANGTVRIGEANLATAKTKLSYTDIVAPISGKIGRSKVFTGNVVGPESGPLTLIVSQDPMYVIFPVSQHDLPQVQKAYRSGYVNIRIGFADGSAFNQLGTINFIDVTVDRATEAVDVRATISNPKGRLIDGEIVQVRLESALSEEAVLIPQSALMFDQKGAYVFVVENGSAAVRRVKADSEVGASVAIIDGLAAGEQVIVRGLQRVPPDLPVVSQPGAESRPN